MGDYCRVWQVRFSVPAEGETGFRALTSLSYLLEIVFPFLFRNAWKCKSDEARAN